MKNKKIAALLTAALMTLGTVTAVALDYAIPATATTVTQRFTTVNQNEENDEFAMVSDDGQLTIHITNDTLLYFEDFVPLSDECDGMTQMVRDVLFGRTVAEVLNNRNMRVIFEPGDHIEPISVQVLFEIAVALPQPIELDEEGLLTPMATPDIIEIADMGIEIEAISLVENLNGTIIVANEQLLNHDAPYLENGIVMLPLRAIAEALGYDVSWNDELKSVQLGVGRHIWIGNTEAVVGRMAPIELSAAPVLVDDITFVPLDFFMYVLSQTVNVVDGQVYIG